MGVKRPKRRAGVREARPQARGSLRDARRFPRNHGCEGETVEYRQLGRSGLRISAMTLGTMGFGGGSMFANLGTGDVQDARRQTDLAIFGTGDVQDARRQIDLALEAGVNTIDTADIYSTRQGGGDRRSGAWVPPGRRHPGHQGPLSDG